MAATATAVDVVRAFFIALGLLLGTATAKPLVQQGTMPEPSWAVEGQNAERQVVPANPLPEYLATAPLILGERLPRAGAPTSWGGGD